ncbi:stretch-activated cation channel mid1 [Yamadazyma tenuis]|nr:stretch-activated cation channel mid1 [Yamadazyma tenuis]
MVSLLSGVIARVDAWVDLGIDINQPMEAGDNFFDDFVSDPFRAKRKDGSEGLEEFTPISATIGQSEIQYFSFNVNTSSGIGSYYEYLIFITGNICSQPANLTEDDPSLTVYYSFNGSMFQNLELGDMDYFSSGYFQALADVPATSNVNAVLYIAVQAPENTDASAVWSYEMGVSQNDLVFQWDDRSWASLVDTDEISALIVTGNLSDSSGFDSSDYNISHSRYSLFIYSHQYKDYFRVLNNSWCAIRSGPALFSSDSDPDLFESSFTTRGGGWQQQFYVGGLNKSTQYIAYLISDFSGRDFGGAVYQPFEFKTMDSGACNLIYDLDFCDQVAYSVPNSDAYSKEELKSLFDDRARSLYANFSRVMQQIPCDESDVSAFSPFRTCDDCADSYKNWLCAVTIPRCSTRNITGYRETEPGDSRNSWINDVLDPDLMYYEMLPCLNVCEAIVRDCPAELGFGCPNFNRTVLSYYWEDPDEEYPTCNFVGKTATTKSAAPPRYLVNYALAFATVLVLALL